MALFTDPVDRYFVGKLVVGLLFGVSAARLLIGTLRFTMGRPAPSWESMAWYGIAAAVWFALFQLIESRRRRRVPA